MAKSYAGYAERKEQGKAFDIGGALRTEVIKIKTADEAETARRDKLLSEYETAKKKIENIDQGKSKGFQNWMQEQITKVTTRMYEDAKTLIKRKGRNENEYRRVKQNMMSSWNMLARRAKNWNEHYEAGLKGVADGKISPFGAAMLGEDSKIGDLANLDMVIDDDGNMTLEGIGEDGSLYTSNLTSILAPENSYDESLDSAGALKKMMKSLPPTKVDLGGGKFREDQSLHPAFNKQRLINNQAALSNARDKSKWYSALFDNKVKNVFSQTTIDQNVTDYLDSDVGQMEIEQLKKDPEFLKRYSGVQDPWLTSAAMSEIRGEQYMLNVFGSKNKNEIRQPNFDHTFTIPKDGEPIVITYDEIDPTTGEIVSRTETYMPGDEVPIGDRQDKRIKAALYEAQGAMVDYKESGGGISDRDRKYKENERLKLDANVNAYETGRDFSRGINLEKLKADGKVKDIKLIEDHIHSTTGDEGPYMVITTNSGDIVELPYETDDEGNITEEGYDKMNANLQKYIQNESKMHVAKANFEKGKAESQRRATEAGTTYTPGAGTTGRRTRYVGINEMGDEQALEIKKGDKKTVKWKLGEKLDAILTDANKQKDTNGKAVDDMYEILSDLSQEKKDSIKSDIKITRTSDPFTDTMTVTIGDKKWEIKIDNDDNIQTRRAELKKKVDEILEAYHYQPKETKKKKLPGT